MPSASPATATGSLVASGAVPPSVPHAVVLRATTARTAAAWRRGRREVGMRTDDLPRARGTTGGARQPAHQRTSDPMLRSLRRTKSSPRSRPVYRARATSGAGELGVAVDGRLHPVDDGGDEPAVLERHQARDGRPAGGADLVDQHPR